LSTIYHFYSTIRFSINCSLTLFVWSTLTAITIQLEATLLRLIITALSEVGRLEKCMFEKNNVLIFQGFIWKKQACCTKGNFCTFCTKTGSKSIVLLGQIRSAASAPVGETYNSFELLNNNFSVPAEETYYNCRLFQLPTFSSKHHLVRVRDFTSHLCWLEVSYLNRITLWITLFCVNISLSSMTFKISGSQRRTEIWLCFGKCRRFCAVTLLQNVCKATVVLYVQWFEFLAALVESLFHGISSIFMKSCDASKVSIAWFCKLH